MIFVTVGTQQPFDRLVQAVDAWAAQSGVDVLAQIGLSKYQPRHIRAVRFMSTVEYAQAVQQADALVAHAGMGSLITALEFGKPIVVMPKRADLKETRGDHQFATARHFCEPRSIPVVNTDEELFAALNEIGSGGTSSCARFSQPSPELLQAIRSFVLNT